MIQVATRCVSLDDFVEKFARFAFEGALVLPASGELAVGTEGRFAVLLRDRSVAMRGHCRVTEAKPAPGNTAAGARRTMLRVALLEMDDASRAVHARLLAASRLPGAPQPLPVTEGNESAATRDTIPLTIGMASDLASGPHRMERPGGGRSSPFRVPGRPSTAEMPAPPNGDQTMPGTPPPPPRSFAPPPAAPAKATGIAGPPTPAVSRSPGGFRSGPATRRAKAAPSPLEVTRQVEAPDAEWSRISVAPEPAPPATPSAHADARAKPAIVGGAAAGPGTPAPSPPAEPKAGAKPEIAAADRSPRAEPEAPAKPALPVVVAASPPPPPEPQAHPAAGAGHAAASPGGGGSPRVSAEPKPRAAARAETRAPGAALKLPANPFSDLGPEDLASFVDCTLFEMDTGAEAASPDESSPAAILPARVPVETPVELPALPAPAAMAAATSAPIAKPEARPTTKERGSPVAPVASTVVPGMLVTALPPTWRRVAPWLVLAGSVALGVGVGFTVRSGTPPPGAARPVTAANDPPAVAPAAPAPSAPIAPAAAAPTTTPRPEAAPVAAAEPPQPTVPEVAQPDAVTVRRGTGSATGCAASVITEPPGVQVTWGRKVIGESPVDGAKVPCGTATVTLRRDRYETATQEVTVAEGSTASITRHLRRPPATLVVGSSPPHGEILVNGQPQGTAPQRITVSRYQTALIEVSLPGYAPWKKDVYVRQPEMRIGMQLHPAPHGEAGKPAAHDVAKAPMAADVAKPAAPAEAAKPTATADAAKPTSTAETPKTVAAAESAKSVPAPEPPKPAAAPEPAKPAARPEAASPVPPPPEPPKRAAPSPEEKLAPPSAEEKLPPPSSGE